MKRRTVLASAGFAVFTSGCAGLLSTECAPGENELGAVEERVARGEDPGEVSVRGVVVKFVDGRMVLHDTTGMAEFAPPGWKEFNEEWFEPGDCVEATGMVNSNSREFGTLHVQIPTEDEVESVGSAERDPPTVPDEPDVSFAVEYADGDDENDFPDDAVRLTHAGGEAVPVEELEVRRIYGDDLSTHPWRELAGETPDAEVSEGDSVTFERPGRGRLAWRYDEHWSRPVSGGWSL